MASKKTHFHQETPLPSTGHQKGANSHGYSGGDRNDMEDYGPSGDQGRDESSEKKKH